MSNEHLALKGALVGHNDWVTQIATTAQFPDVVLSASRDKSIIIWQLNNQQDSTGEISACGAPNKSLRGHSHFVSDVVISSDGLFAVSGSWDGSLRLWDLSVGTSTRRFVSHKKDVLSVAFSADNRQIVSGSRDKTIKLWNTVGQCRFYFFVYFACLSFRCAHIPMFFFLQANTPLWMITTLIGFHAFASARTNENHPSFRVAGINLSK